VPRKVRGKMTLKSDRYGIIVEIRNGSALTQPLEGGAWRARGKMVQTLTLFWLTRGRVSNDPEEAPDPYGLAEGNAQKTSSGRSRVRACVAN